MVTVSRRIAVICGIILGCTLAGCGGEESKPAGEPTKLSPGMEQMKNEMLKSYQSKTLGKAPPAEPGK
jgi:hypothetical protein